jgi:hypothetical protein
VGVGVAILARQNEGPKPVVVGPPEGEKKDGEKGPAGAGVVKKEDEKDKKGPEKKQEPIKPARPPLEVVEWEMKHAAADPGADLRYLGTLMPGNLSVFTVREKDTLRIAVKLSEPAYCYLVAFNTNGEEELLYPASLTKRPTLGKEVAYPETVNGDFQFNEGTGLQAIAVVASRDPLPSYQAMKKQGQGAVLWEKMSPDLAWGMWWSDGERAHPLGDWMKYLDRQERSKEPPRVRPNQHGFVVAAAAVRQAGSGGLAGLPWGCWLAATEDGPQVRTRDLAASLRRKTAAELVEVRTFAVRPRR